jgi:hypothetical protein
LVTALVAERNSQSSSSQLERGFSFPGASYSGLLVFEHVGNYGCLRSNTDQSASPWP